jgi:SAM-dependent methyltransferase
MLPTFPPQAAHAVLPEFSAEDVSRQLFARDLRRHVMFGLSGAVKKVHDRDVKPAFEARHGRPLRDRAELRDAMWRQGFLRAAWSVQRVSQELIWASVLPAVEKQADRLNALVAERNRNPVLGSLRLDGFLRVPDYLREVDIHVMPGSYQGEYGPDDASQGALFERGAFLYNLGMMGPLNDGIGALHAATLRRLFPALKPRRILDMGCTSGHQTLPFCDAFPGAEVHALDVAAPMLRYGHARAESLGKAVHFHQQDAAHTAFPDGHFDLVVSNIMLHETCAAAVPEIIAESFRLLAPGGVMSHLDIPDYNRNPDLLFQMTVDADHFHNNEPFWGALHELDLVALATEAGFEPASVSKSVAPMGALAWMLLVGRKAAG